MTATLCQPPTVPLRQSLVAHASAAPVLVDVPGPAWQKWHICYLVKFLVLLFCPAWQKWHICYLVKFLVLLFCPAWQKWHICYLVKFLVVLFCPAWQKWHMCYLVKFLRMDNWCHVAKKRRVFAGFGTYPPILMREHAYT